MRGSNFGTPVPMGRLFSATRLTQQSAVTAAHQGNTVSDQADGAVAQIVALPGPFGDTPGSKQALSDFAIRVAFDPGVERTQRQRQPLSPLWRQFLKRGTSWAPAERQPETARGMAATLEIAIKHQFSGVARVRDRWLHQPQPVLDVPNAQQDMPAVRGLPDIT